MVYVIIALAVRIFANPAANLFQKRLTMHDGRGGREDANSTGRANGLDPVVVNLSTYLLLSVGCIAAARSVDWAAMPREFWWNCLLVGLFGGVGNAFLVKALQRGELSVLGPVNSWKSMIGMAVGVVVLGEIPGVWGLVGIALIVAGSYFVLLGPGESFTWRLLARKDIRWRIFAMVFTAVEAVFIKRVIELSSPAVSFVVWCWFGALASFVVALLFVRRCTLLDSIRAIGNSRNLVLCLGIAVCVGLAQYATNVIFERMDVGYSLALFQLSAIVSVLFGWRVFKERGVARKLTGSFIMVAGSVVIILLS